MKTIIVWASLAILQCANSFTGFGGVHARSLTRGHKHSDLSPSRNAFTARAAKLSNLTPTLPSKVGYSAPLTGSIIGNTWTRVKVYRARVTQWHERVLEQVLGTMIGDEWSHWVVSRFGSSLLPVFTRAYMSLIRR